MLDSGQVDAAVLHLKGLGMTKVQSIRALQQAGMEYPASKRAVHESPAWEAVRQRDDEFHVSLGEALGKPERGTRFEKPRPRAICIDDHEYLGDVDGCIGPPKPDARFVGSLTIGKVYEVRGEDLGMWAIEDDTGEVYLYPKTHFRLLPPE
jgi:hypothetical protein